MTDKTEPPLRIYAEPCPFTGWLHASCSNVLGGADDGAEYVRADALDARDALIADLVEALGRIVSASDYYGKEASDHDTLTLAYAHQSTGHIARAALAKAKASSD